MKQFEDHFDWYRLGLIHRLRSFRATDSIRSRSYDIVQSSLRLALFYNNKLNAERLPGSTEAAKALFNTLGELYQDRDKDDAVIGFRAESLIGGLNNFETLLKHEVKNLNTFMLENVGIFDTNKLIDHADEHLSAIALQVVDARVKEDFKAAGRCLAFDLFTACGFHAVRALEAAARVLCKKLIGKDAEQTGTPLGGIANDLRDFADDTKNNGQNPLAKEHPLRLVISNLYQMNNIYRKPLAHPQMVLTTHDDARKVFDLVTISIGLISELLNASP